MFRLGRDWYSDAWLPQQLLAEAALVIVLLAVVFAGLHLVRRGLGTPRHYGGEVPPPAEQFERYEAGARLYHWGNLAFLLLLIVSGLALYRPGWLQPPGASWLLLHEIGAGLFVLGLALHIVFAFWRADPRTMWVARGDGAELRASLQYYGGGRPDLPRAGKYDAWQKLYHAFLTLLAIASIATGVSLFLNAEVLASFTHDWMRWQRLIHDLAAFSFVAVILAHAYVRLTRQNWPTLAAMITGRISRRDFLARYDWRRWQPPPADGGLGARQRTTLHRQESRR